MWKGGWVDVQVSFLVKNDDSPSVQLTFLFVQLTLLFVQLTLLFVHVWPSLISCNLHSYSSLSCRLPAPNEYSVHSLPDGDGSHGTVIVYFFLPNSKSIGCGLTTLVWRDQTWMWHYRSWKRRMHHSRWRLQNAGSFLGNVLRKCNLPFLLHQASQLP